MKRHYLQKAITIYRLFGLRELLRTVKNKIKNMLHDNTQVAMNNISAERLLLCQQELCPQKDFSHSGITLPQITIFAILQSSQTSAIDDTIQSLLNLNYPNYRVVLLSDSANVNLCEKFETIYITTDSTWKDKLDEQIRTVSEGYITILQAGDCLTENSLNYVAKEILRSTPEMIYTDCYIDVPESSDNSPKLYPAFSFSAGILGSGLFFRRDIITDSLKMDSCTVYDLLAALVATVLNLRGSIKYIQHALLMSKTNANFYEYHQYSKNVFAFLADSHLKSHNIRVKTIWHNGSNQLRIQRENNPLVSMIIYFHPHMRMDFRSVSQLILDTNYSNLEYIFAVPEQNVDAVREFFKMNPIIITPYRKNATPAEAFNVAAASARGSFLTFLYNGLSCSSGNWLSSHVDFLELYSADAISPLVEDNFGRIPPSSMSLMDLDEDVQPDDKEYAIKCAEQARNQLCMTSVLSRYCLTIRRQSYESIGKFNESKEADAYFNIEASLRLTSKKRLMFTDGIHPMTIEQNLICSENEIKDSCFSKLIRLYGADIQTAGLSINGSMRFLMEKGLCDDGLYWPENAVNLTCEKSILLINHELSRTGTPQVVLKAARVLKKAGYFVVAASCVDGPMRDDFLAEGVPVVINHTLAKYRSYEPNRVAVGITPQVDRMLRGFDLTLVASIVGHNFINAFNGSDVKILWWVHDGYTGFMLTQPFFPKTIQDNIHTYCGGVYAQKVMQQFCPTYKLDSLLYGVEDYAEKVLSESNSSNEEQLFLIPATLDERKNQLTFIRAVASLPHEMVQKARYILVGKAVDDAYLHKLQKESANIPNFTISDPVPYDELMEMYRKATCIVMPSKDDPMPVVLAEAMMMSKIVICSDMTGTAHYIADGINGFVFPFASPKKLAEKMQFVIENYAFLDGLRKNARMTYESEFSEAAFDKKLTDIITSIL